MKFLNEKEVGPGIVTQDFYMPKIDIDHTQTKKLVQQIGKLNLDDKLLSDINVLKQEITEIHTLQYSYVHMNQRLQFSELSRGEKVFLVSLASKYTGQSIYLEYDILQLTKTNLRVYYEMFKDCDSIYIIYKEDEIKNYLEYVMYGEIK